MDNPAGDHSRGVGGVKRAIKSVLTTFGIIPGGRQALAHMRGIAGWRPLDINVETTNFCPASCVFCPNSKGKRQRQMMDMALFEKVVEEFYRLGGGAVGISSMQSDIFSDAMLLDRLSRLQKYKDGFWLHTTTNLIGAKKLSDVELETFLSSFSFIEISIGGFSRDEYREMYGVDAFDVVYRQLSRISRIVRDKKLGVRLGVSIRTKNRDAFRNFDLPEELSDVYELREIKDKFFSWGGVITEADLPAGAKLDTAANTSQRGDCVVPWASLSVNVDGSVVGCGCVDWYSSHVIGDIKNQTIAEIWNSERANEFRKAFSRQQIPALCKDCTLYNPVDDTFSRKRLLHYKPTDGLYYAV